MSTIVNGAPMTYFDGIEDRSTRSLAAEAQATPSHLPKIYLYAAWGPDTPQLVAGSAATLMYGANTFDPTSKYANHATVLANKQLGAPNQCVIERVIPNDVGPKATIRLYLDVLETTVPIYQRNQDGSLARDVDGNLIATNTTTPGIKYKWVIDTAHVVQGEDDFGQATQVAGDQINPQTQTQSVRYPIMDLRVPHFGSRGNNYGLRMSAPTNTGTNPMDVRPLTEEKFYPFNISCLSRKDELSTATQVATIRGEESILVSFKPDAILRATKTQMGITKTFIDAYQMLNDPVNPPQWGPFGELHLYQSSVDTVLKKMYTVEAPHANEFSDFGTSVANAVIEENKYLVNMINAVSSQNVPYTAVQLVTTGNFVHLSNSSVLYAQGASDGTMNNDAFADLVSARVIEYSNILSPLQDSASNPESVFYDSGFPVQTKLDLLNFIAVRKDTVVGLALHDASGRALTTSEETSLAVALATRARLYPESTYHGTSACRVFILGRSGTFLNSEYVGELPVLIDQAEKYAQYMGADNGKWKAGYAPDVSPRNIITTMADFNSTFTPVNVRQNDWSIGLNWIQKYDYRRAFIPAMKTVYPDDTSVLTSVITTFACARLQRIGEAIWRDYTGRADLTKAQLRQEVEREVTERTRDMFDGRYVIQGEVVFTKADTARGYSWNLRIHIYANNMQTVQVLSVVAHRMEDLET